MRKIYALGPAGTYGHEAAELVRKFRPGMSDCQLEFCGSNEEILGRVEAADSADVFGVAPVENSTAGLVRAVIKFWMRQKDSWSQNRLQVIGEVGLPVHHCLLAYPGVKDVSAIQSVTSHPQALSQCDASLARLGLSIKEPTLSTAVAAQYVSDHGNSEAMVAIASEFAAKVYGLDILERHLEDENANETKFHLVGRQPTSEVAESKTAVLFWLRDEPAALHDAMGAIAAAKANMSSIHSIPLGERGKFAFYVEFQGHLGNDVTRSVLTIMKARTDRFVILGSFAELKGDR